MDRRRAGWGLEIVAPSIPSAGHPLLEGFGETLLDFLHGEHGEQQLVAQAAPVVG
jgi:hypothetical protein